MLILTEQVKLPATSVMGSMTSQLFLRNANEFDMYPHSQSDLRAWFAKSALKYDDIVSDPLTFIEFCSAPEQEFLLEKSKLSYAENEDGELEKVSADDMYEEDGVLPTSLEMVRPTDYYNYLISMISRYIKQIRSNKIAGKLFVETQVQDGVVDQESGDVLFDSDLRAEDTQYSAVAEAKDLAKLRYTVRRLVEMSYVDKVFYLDILRLTQRAKKVVKGTGRKPSTNKDEILRNVCFWKKTAASTGYWTNFNYATETCFWYDLIADINKYVQEQPCGLNSVAVRLMNTLTILMDKYEIDFSDEDTTKFYRENLPLSVVMSIPSNKEYKESLNAYKTMQLGEAENKPEGINRFDACLKIKDVISGRSLYERDKNETPIDIEAYPYFEDRPAADLNLVYSFLFLLLDGKIPPMDKFAFSGGILTVFGQPFIRNLPNVGYLDVLKHAGISEYNTDFFIMENGFIVPYYTTMLPQTLFVANIEDMYSTLTDNHVGNVERLVNCWCILK